jgi:hypothetical protein
MAIKVAERRILGSLCVLWTEAFNTVLHQRRCGMGWPLGRVTVVAHEPSTL